MHNVADYKRVLEVSYKKCSLTASGISWETDVVVLGSVEESTGSCIEV